MIVVVLLKMIWKFIPVTLTLHSNLGFLEGFVCSITVFLWQVVDGRFGAAPNESTIHVSFLSRSVFLKYQGLKRTEITRNNLLRHSPN